MIITYWPGLHNAGFGATLPKSTSDAAARKVVLPCATFYIFSFWCFR